MWLNLLLVAAGFILLLKGADFFVDGASALADRLGIPPLIVGLTIVAMGTSLPEASVSINAAFKESGGIAIGNILGSNILNILLILGVTAVLSPLKVGKTTVRYEIPYMILVTAVLAAAGLWLGELNRFTGMLFWVLFLLYFVYLFYQARHMQADETGSKKLALPLILVYILGGLLAVVWGSDLTVTHAELIAEALGVSDRIIGLTVVAFGTSLPELITSVTAARKQEADIAIGNIVGSNIFNILFVLGTASLISPIAYSPAFWLDSLAAVLAAALLLLCVCRRGELSRRSGILLLACYAVYFVYMLLG